MQPSKTHLDIRTIRFLKYWTWQFVIIRPICSILMITLQILGIYPSWVSWTFTVILNLSFALAMYSLVVFYHVFAKELKPHKPLAKFLCVKGIVFFSFWQVKPFHCLLSALFTYFYCGKCQFEYRTESAKSLCSLYTSICSPGLNLSTKTMFM